MVDDILSSLDKTDDTNKRALNAYNNLKKNGYFDSKNLQDSYSSNKFKDDAKKVADTIGGYTLMRRNDLVKKYSRMGYDAIADPEDYVRGNQSATIIVNGKTFIESHRELVSLDEIKNARTEYGL